VETRKRSSAVSKAWLALVALLIPYTACSSTSPTSLDPSQEILFHSSYVNYAWGFQSAGWYVDRDGFVWRMSPPLQWNAEVSRLLAGKQTGPLVYLATDLEAEYAQAQDSLLLALGQDELREMISLVGAAAAGEYSGPTSTGADQGGKVLGALHYDSRADTYRKILLSLRGDQTVVNRSAAAARLEIWLVEIEQRIAMR